jgi:hypothetical protein
VQGAASCSAQAVVVLCGLKKWRRFKRIADSEAGKPRCNRKRKYSPGLQESAYGSDAAGKMTMKGTEAVVGMWMVNGMLWWRKRTG